MYNFYLESITTDYNADDTPDYISTSTYDERGNLTSESQDYDADGIPESITTSTYDKHGNLTSDSRNYHADGIPDLITTSTYDEHGNLTSESQDYDADGIPESITTSTYDEHGNLTSYNYDYDADGIPDSIDIYTYNEHSNQTSYSSDSDGDGISDYISTSTYDEHGNLTSESQDYNADGIPDSIDIYTYDEHSNQTSYSSDSDGDGISDYISTSTYNEHGNLTSKSYDYDADGIPDLITTSTYDEHGNLTSESQDDDADGIPDYISIFTYDEDGNLTSYSQDDDADGIPNYISTFTYDEDGNQTSESYDDDADGIPESITTYIYDEHGNLTSESYDGHRYLSYSYGIPQNSYNLIELEPTVPTLENPLADVEVIENREFSLIVPENTFNDVDEGDTLTYFATLEDGSELPSWLTFDAATGIFSGTPDSSNLGIYDVRVIATDSSGTTAEQIFSLNVRALRDLPILSLSDLVQSQNNHTTLSLTLSNPEPVKKIEFEFISNSDLLDINAIALNDSLPDNWTLTQNEIDEENGLVKVTLEGSDPLTGSSFNLIDFEISIPDSAEYGATQTLKLQAVKFDDEYINLNLKNSTQLIAKLGDITADGHLDDSDIYSISRLAVGLDTDVDSFSGIKPNLIADMNKDNVVSAFDAYLAYTAMD
jgi:hypothetical protein